MKLSIVTTLYRSANFIRDFHARISESARAITDSYEIIFVNDGSPDDSLEVALRLHEIDPHVVVVDLSRNFGHHRAMMTGLMHTEGERVFLIDVDLEAEPESLLPFWEKLEAEEDCDVVYGVQAKRNGSIIERLTGEIYYRIVADMGGLSIPRNLTTTRLMTARYVRSLVRHQERELVISGLWVATGYKQIPMPVERGTRRQSSNYGFFRKLRLAIDFVTSYSANFLYQILYLGLVIAGGAFAILLFFILSYFAKGGSVPGWTSVIVSVWFFGGLGLALNGLIGLYIARIFQETKRRPYSIVRELHRRERE